MTPDTSEAARARAGIEPLALNTPPDPRCELCVVVPVRDEAATLAQTLASLARQTTPGGAPLDARRYEVILLANNCRDDSAEVARRFAGEHARFNLHVVERRLPAAYAHVGAARRLLMDAALDRFASLESPRGVIATTDGDTRVAPDWVAQTLAEIDRGADAVGGRITIDRGVANASAVSRERSRSRKSETRLLRLRDNAYRLLATTLSGLVDPCAHDPLPRHHQHFGASFAITAAAYRRAGGVPVVSCLEDVALYRALRRADMRFRHSPAVRVETSDREDGRARVGLSYQLREWSELSRDGRAWLVPSGGEIERRATLERELRRVWRGSRAGLRISPGEVWDLAAALAVRAPRLAAEVERCKTFGSLLDRVEREQAWTGAWRARWSLVAVERAIVDLRERIARHRSRPEAAADLRAEAALAPAASRDAGACAAAAGRPFVSDALEQVEPVTFGAAAGQAT